MGLQFRKTFSFLKDYFYSKCRNFFYIFKTVFKFFTTANGRVVVCNQTYLDEGNYSMLKIIGVHMINTS